MISVLIDQSVFLKFLKQQFRRLFRQTGTASQSSIEPSAVCPAGRPGNPLGFRPSASVHLDLAPLNLRHTSLDRGRNPERIPSSLREPRRLNPRDSSAAPRKIHSNLQLSLLETHSKTAKEQTWQQDRKKLRTAIAILSFQWCAFRDSNPGHPD